MADIKSIMIETSNGDKVVGEVKTSYVTVYAECRTPDDEPALYKFQVDIDEVKCIYVLDVSRRLFIVEFNDQRWSYVLVDRDHRFSF